MNEADLSAAEKLQRAHDLAVAAVLGDTVYNFGELMMHPILASLKGTQHEWLGNLLLAFNAGDIGKFDVISANFSKQVHLNYLMMGSNGIYTQPLFGQNAAFLRQKLCLMALIELVFKRTGADRRISFSVIGQETRLPPDEVKQSIVIVIIIRLNTW